MSESKAASKPEKKPAGSKASASKSKPPAEKKRKSSAQETTQPNKRGKKEKDEETEESGSDNEEEDDNEGGGEEEEEEVTQSSKKKKGASGRDHKGLRHFSILVCEKLAQLGTSTYKEIADQLVNESHMQASHIGYDEKNIRRRIYDALNVLMAMDIITKERKQIRWKGFQTQGQDSNTEEAQPLQPSVTTIKLKTKLEQIKSTVKQKQSMLEEITLQFLGLKSLIARNSTVNHSLNEKLRMPFIVVDTPTTTDIKCEMSENYETVLLTYNAPFNLSDDKLILRLLGANLPGLTGSKSDSSSNDSTSSSWSKSKKENDSKTRRNPRDPRSLVPEDVLALLPETSILKAKPTIQDKADTNKSNQGVNKQESEGEEAVTDNQELEQDHHDNHAHGHHQTTVTSTPSTNRHTTPVSQHHTSYTHSSNYPLTPSAVNTLSASLGFATGSSSTAFNSSTGLPPSPMIKTGFSIPYLSPSASRFSHSSSPNFHRLSPSNMGLQSHAFAHALSANSTHINPSIITTKFSQANALNANNLLQPPTSSSFNSQSTQNASSSGQNNTELESSLTFLTHTPLSTPAKMAINHPVTQNSTLDNPPIKQE